MNVLLALSEPRAAALVTEYGIGRGHRVEAVDCGDAEAYARFRAYDAVICDASFGGAFGAGGLQALRAARRRHPDTRTIVLTTVLSREIEDALARGDVDAMFVKPQPLARIFDCLDRPETPVSSAHPMR